MSAPGKILTPRSLMQLLRHLSDEAKDMPLLIEQHGGGMRDSIGLAGFRVEDDCVLLTGPTR